MTIVAKISIKEDNRESRILLRHGEIEKGKETKERMGKTKIRW